jgi:hypothetical protein
MKRSIIAAFIFSFLVTTLHARQSIREGEQSGIPDREDVEKEMKETGKKETKEKKKEVRENQEDTDPVFYDSTTSPKEMEEENHLRN